jgi:hypothetical protein
MPKNMSTLGAVLMVAVIVAGVGGWGLPAVAKKPPCMCACVDNWFALPMRAPRSGRLEVQTLDLLVY